MKSLALSLLVALGVSLGTVNAFADSGRTASPLEAAAASARQAKAHAEIAQQYRVAARVATDKAQLARKIVENDLKQGFTYEAGVERDKAIKLELLARRDLASAAREDALAAQCRAEAQREMVLFQQTLGVAPHR